jgi:hypothetical protein
MVGSKLDLEYKRSVSRSDAFNKSKYHQIYDVIECSSKTGYNVKEIFTNITEEILCTTGLM